MLTSTILAIIAVALLFIYLDWYTQREFDRQFQKFFVDTNDEDE